MPPRPVKHHRDDWDMSPETSGRSRRAAPISSTLTRGPHLTSSAIGDNPAFTTQDPMRNTQTGKHTRLWKHPRADVARRGATVAGWNSSAPDDGGMRSISIDLPGSS